MTVTVGGFIVIFIGAVRAVRAVGGRKGVIGGGGGGGPRAYAREPRLRAARTNRSEAKRSEAKRRKQNRKNSIREGISNAESRFPPHRVVDDLHHHLCHVASVDRLDQVLSVVDLLSGVMGHG